MTLNHRIAVGPVSEIPPGSAKGVSDGDHTYVVVNVEGEFHGIDGLCTHAYAELDKGFVAGDTITCPLHFSQFDVTSGEPRSPPADEPLRTYATEVDGDVVFLVLDGEASSTPPDIGR